MCHGWPRRPLHLCGASRRPKAVRPSHTQVGASLPSEQISSYLSSTAFCFIWLRSCMHRAFDVPRLTVMVTDLYWFVVLLQYTPKPDLSDRGTTSNRPFEAPSLEPLPCWLMLRVGTLSNNRYAGLYCIVCTQRSGKEGGT